MGHEKKRIGRRVALRRIITSAGVLIAGAGVKLSAQCASAPGRPSASNCGLPFSSAAPWPQTAADQACENQAQGPGLPTPPQDADCGKHGNSGGFPNAHNDADCGTELSGSPSTTYTDQDCAKQTNIGVAHADQDCGIAKPEGGVHLDNDCHYYSGVNAVGWPQTHADGDCGLPAVEPGTEYTDEDNADGLFNPEPPSP